MPQYSKFALSRRHAMGLMASSALVPSMAFAQTSDASARLRSLLDLSAARDARLHPLSSDQAHVMGKAPAFVDPYSDFYRNRLIAFRREESEALKAINRAALSAVEAIAYDVFAYYLNQTITLFDRGLFDVQTLAPFDASFGMHVEFPDYISGGSARFDTLADYRLNLARMDGFAAYMANVVTKAREGLTAGYLQPRVLIENVLGQVDAMLAMPIEDSPFWFAIKRMPASITGTSRKELEKLYRARIENAIYPAYGSWRTFLRDEYLPRASSEPGRWAMKDGSALYAWELARHTTTTKTPDEIHDLGLSEVSRIRKQMEQVRQTVGFEGDLKAFFEYIRTNPEFYCKTPEELIDRFETIEARIWPNIPKLFHHSPKAPFEVRALPALGDQRGTGYYRTGPPDGKSPGILFFNMSMLDTRPIPTLETLTLHEGIPGHHFQTTLAQEDDALPELLQKGKATAFTEGWGLYAESLGPELGLFKDPMQLFGHHDMAMLRAVRLVVDTGIHAKRWSRQKAIEFMLANTSMAPRDVSVEIDRYISYPGQACAYKVGELKIRELRDRASRRLGERFDVRDYHHQVIGTGCLPMDVLETKVANWIATGGGMTRS